MLICIASILLSGCEAILNSLVNEPLFSAGEEWYDGQTYQIVKLSACTYDFEEDSEYVTLKENSKGKMIATVEMWDDIFNLGQESTVRITARNADDPEVDPFFVDVKLKPWALAIYDKDDNIVDKMTAGQDYSIVMVTGLRKPVPVVLSGGGLTSEDNPQNLSWNLSSSEGILTAGEETSTTIKVRASSVGNCKVKATLGHRTVELAVKVVADETAEFSITPAKDMEWAGGAVQIGANREVAKWSFEVQGHPVDGAPSQDGTLATCIMDNGTLVLGMYRHKIGGYIWEETDATINVKAETSDGKTATCSVVSKAWKSKFFLCGSTELNNPTTVKVGDLVCLKFEDLSYEAITDEEFLNNVKVTADNGQVKLTQTNKEGNHFQFKVEKTTGGKISQTLGIKASYGAFDEDTRNITVSE
jgi:hypothetical protein